MTQFLKRNLNKWSLGYLAIALLGTLFAGFIAMRYSALPEVFRQEEYLDYAAIALLMALSLAAWDWQRRHVKHMEHKIHRRTAELEQTLDVMNLLKSVATAANESASVKEGFQMAIDNICAYTGWTFGHAYLLSEEKRKLISLDVWHMDDPAHYAAFKRVSEMIELSPDEGFLGEVFADSTPMWIMDVAHSSSYERKEAAVEAGLKAAFGFPVYIGRKAVAVLEFYSPHAQIPDEQILNSMANIGKQLGQTIERAQSREEALLLKTVIQSANDAIIITKAELENPGPQIVYVNEAFSRISGYRPEEVIGQSPRLLQGEETDRETLAAIGAALREGQPFRGELLNYAKNGKPYWLSMSIVPVRDWEGNITHFAAIERDITARKASEAHLEETMRQLKRANLKSEAAARDLQESLIKAEEANKAKSDFLANMSHELRTPMNGVLGMAHLLAESALDTEQRELVTTINSSGENLLMLLNDILDFSKIEAGALELESIAFPFTDTLRQTVTLLQPQAEKKEIALMMDPTLELPHYLWGDPGRVRQIVMNLLSNAVKFTETGYVRLSATLQRDGKGDKICVSVQDTGIGIPAAKLEEIFEKFTQTDASVTRKYGGTGLGLAITKQLVTLMGGEMGVESVEGKGSTFWFSLPCNPAEEKDLPDYRAHETRVQSGGNLMPAGQAKVLLVEDYPVNRVFAQKLLGKFGFQDIDLAENGLEAIEKCQWQSYDIIFMDCQMPEMDGYQATQKIRQLERQESVHTPIVAMTANAMIGDREKCLSAGMDAYLSKPLRIEHVSKTIGMWFAVGDEAEKITANSIPTAAAVESAPAPVDLEQLRMFTDGDPEEERILTELFFEQAQEMVTMLERHTGVASCDAWQSAAHRFKGASGNFGAMTLHHLCKQAESRFEEEEAEKQEVLAAIRQELAQVKDYMDAQLACA